MSTVATRPQSSSGVAGVPHRPQRLRGRPELYTSYAADMALLNTTGKKVGVGALVLAAALAPFLLTDDVLGLLLRSYALAIGAIGLNLVTGYAGQVSLGHAFFVGLGAYTASILAGDPEGRVVGYGLPIFVWLPAAAVVAGLAGLVVAPIATRLRGLYLAIVTLGLVFLGEHIFREARSLTGGVGVGRDGPPLVVLGLDLRGSGAMLTGTQKTYLFCLVMLVVAAVLGRNLARSALGRAFAAVRDRDIAAEVIGVGLTRTKLIAFTVSSAYAGVCGAVLYSALGYLEPGSFSLLLSVQFIAMVLIGGVATISGSIMGALTIGLLGRITQELPGLLPFISAQPTGGGLLTSAQLESVLYGILIVAFLIFEPRGLYGVWLRTRAYWKGWPFSY